MSMIMIMIIHMNIHIDTHIEGFNFIFSTHRMEKTKNKNHNLIQWPGQNTHIAIRLTRNAA
jgi:hypothetical protein